MCGLLQARSDFDRFKVNGSQPLSLSTFPLNLPSQIVSKEGFHQGWPTTYGLSPNCLTCFQTVYRCRSCSRIQTTQFFHHLCLCVWPVFRPLTVFRNYPTCGFLAWWDSFTQTRWMPCHHQLKLVLKEHCVQTDLEPSCALLMPAQPFLGLMPDIRRHQSSASLLQIFRLFVFSSLLMTLTIPWRGGVFPLESITGRFFLLPFTPFFLVVNTLSQTGAGVKREFSPDKLHLWHSFWHCQEYWSNPPARDLLRQLGWSH